MWNKLRLLVTVAFYCAHGSNRVNFILHPCCLTELFTYEFSNSFWLQCRCDDDDICPDGFAGLMQGNR